MHNPIYIGIDPDIDKSGIAVWNPVLNDYESIECLGFWDIIGFLLDNNKRIKEVRIEAGWLIKTNWHSMSKQGKQGIAETGRRVGMNHKTGQLMVEFCEKYNIPHKSIKPLSNNYWAESAEKFAATTGWKGKTNPEKRDAAMLVFGLK